MPPPKLQQELLNAVRIWAERQAVSIEAWDAVGQALFVNHAWRNLWQMPETVLVGSGYSILGDAGLQAKPVWSFLYDGFVGRVAVETPPSYYDPRAEDGREGRPRWTEGRIVPLWSGEDDFDELAGPVAFVILLQDVTRVMTGKQRILNASNELQDGLRSCARMKKRELLVWARGTADRREASAHSNRRGLREPGDRIAAAAPPDAALSIAEQRVVALLAEGYCAKEIAALLGKSEKTVYTQFAIASGKLGLESLPQLTVYACRWYG